MIGDLSRINSNFISRGVGNSGLRRRAIQQSTLNDLSSLGKSLSESQATLRAQEFSRDQKFKNAQLKNLNQVARSMGANRVSGGGSGGGSTGGVFGGKDYKATVVNEAAGHNAVNRVYDLEGKDQMRKRFKTFDEMIGYLRELGGSKGLGVGQTQNFLLANPDQFTSQERNYSAKPF